MKRVIGIDPGSRITGLGIIDVAGGELSVIEYGTIKTGVKDIPNRLKTIFVELDALIKQHRPSEFAIERVFVNKNIDSALKLGQARGAAIVSAAVNSVPVFEYSANEIKKAVVGRGHASKEQIQIMTLKLLGLDKIPDSDAADALACAICHINTRQVLSYIKSS